MSGPEDELELVLRRCQQRLSEISLDVPGMDAGAARRAGPAFSLDLPPPAAPAAWGGPLLAPFPPSPAAAPRPAAPAPEPSRPPPAAFVPPPPEPPPAPPVPAAPVPLEKLLVPDEEIDVFPPAGRAPEEPSEPAAPVPAPRPPEQPPAWTVSRAPSSSPAPARAAAPRPSPAVLAAVAGAVLAVGAASVWFARRAPREVALDFARADAFAIGEGGMLLVASDKELSTLSPEGVPAAGAALDAPVDDLSWDQGSLWSVDGREARATERRKDARPTVFNLNHVPDGVFARGEFLWTSEKGKPVLHQYLISRSILGAFLQPLDIFQLPGLVPAAFALDEDGVLWLVDENSRRLYRLRSEGGAYKPVDSAALSPLFGPEGDIRGLRLALAKDAVWILARPSGEGRASLRRVPVSRLDWTAAP